MTGHSGFFKLLGWAIVPVITALLVLGACAPVSPSLSKDTFLPDGSDGAIPSSPVSGGQTFRTSVWGSDTGQGWSNEHVVLPQWQLDEFKRDGWTEVSISNATPAKLIFELTLTQTQIHEQGLSSFNAYLIAKPGVSGVWILRPDASVPESIRLQVRQSVVKVVFDFGAGSESGNSTATEPAAAGDDDLSAENENAESSEATPGETEAETESETAE